MLFKLDIILGHPLSSLLCPPTLLTTLEKVCFPPKKQLIIVLTTSMLKSVCLQAHSIWDCQNGT